MVVTDRKGPPLSYGLHNLPWALSMKPILSLTRPLPKLRYKVKGFHIAEDCEEIVEFSFPSGACLLKCTHGKEKNIQGRANPVRFLDLGQMGPPVGREGGNMEGVMEVLNLNFSVLFAPGVNSPIQRIFKEHV